LEITMNKRPKVLALSTLACMALAASSFASEADGSSGDWKANAKSYKLKHSAHERWDFVLPAERWHSADKAIELPGGLTFETEISGTNKIEIDANADGDCEETVRSTGFVTLRSKNSEGELVKYSVRLRNTGAKKFEWTTGSSMKGKVAGQTLHVFDQDGNGKYSDWGIDAVAIGSNKSASLLSKVVLMSGKLYHFDVTEDGMEVSVAPFDGETGTLNAVGDFESKGKLSSAVFQDGDISFCVAGFRKGVAVPVGTYSFVSGRVEKGSASASIRSGTMQSFAVFAGGETNVEWGADVTGEFSFQQKDDKVSVQSNFKFFGSAGEEYYNFQPRGKGPKIIIADAERGREIKEARFPES
jgi:hypothetical protein